VQGKRTEKIKISNLPLSSWHHC